MAIGSQVKKEAKAIMWQKFKSLLLELPVSFMSEKKGQDYLSVIKQDFIHPYFSFCEYNHFLVQYSGDPELGSLNFHKVHTPV